MRWTPRDFTTTFARTHERGEQEMNYYEYNENKEFLRDSYDLADLKEHVDEFGGMVTDEFGNFVYGSEWLRD